MLLKREIIEKFHSIANQVIEKWSIPGLSYALIVDNEVIHSSGITFSGKKVTNTTLFRIGSNSKAFTCKAALELEKQDTISIDDLIHPILPEFSFNCPELTKKVCLKDLLTHYCGIGKFTSSMMAFLGYEHNDIINGFKHIPSIKPFRSSFQYQNGLYVVVEKILEKVSSTTSSDLMKDIIFKPLSMTHTENGIKNKFINELAIPYDVNVYNENIVIQQSPFPDAIGIGGNIITCAVDLSNWLIYNIEQCSNQDDKIGKKQYLSYVPFSNEKSTNSTLEHHMKWNNYCLGWYQATFRNYNVYDHLGGVPGYTSYLSFEPTKKVGIALLCNKSNMRYPLELLRLNFFELTLTGTHTNLTETVYNENSIYNSKINDLSNREKLDIPSLYQNREWHYYNPMYKSIKFVTNAIDAFIYFEKVNYRISCHYIGNNQFLATDEDKNYHSLFKKICFELKENNNELSMEIFMDNQKGQLSWIEKQRFYNFIA